MRWYKGDLHIHTVLSPCGSLEMSPVTIMKSAVEKGLDFIGIADHNSTLNCRAVKNLETDYGIRVLCGAEVNTKEEVHCLAFFEDMELLQDFQDFLDQHASGIMNDPDIFGYQAVVDEKETILSQVNHLLIAALDAGIETVEKKVHDLNGIFIPAHINRPHNGLLYQLGFIPGHLKAEALEIHKRDSVQGFIDQNERMLEGYTLIKNSDAHHPADIGEPFTWYWLKEPDFNNVRQALLQQEGNKTRIS